MSTSIKISVILIYFLTQANISFGQNYDLKEWIPCLLGADMNRVETQKFLKENNVVLIDTIDNAIAKFDYGYQVKDGKISKIYFQNTFLFPDALKTFFEFPFYYSKLQENQDDLPNAKKLDEEKIFEYKVTRSGLAFTAIYKWNRMDKKYKDFQLAGIEVSLNDIDSNPVEKCKFLFRNSDACVEGDCLLCLVNRNFSSADALIELYDLQPQAGKGLEHSSYGDSYSPVTIYYDRNRNISKIVISKEKFRGRLPLGIKQDEDWEETSNRLGVYSKGSSFNYYGITVDEYYDAIVLRGGSLYDTPVCEIMRPLAIPEYGCIKGNCENGYGRKRYNYFMNMILEYEGGFRDGLRHGDGCEIVNDNYKFGHYEKGYRVSSLKSKLCVDGHCSSPEDEKKETASEYDFTNETTDDKKSTKTEENKQPEKKQLSPKEETDFIVKMQKAKMTERGWRLIKEKNYSYSLTAVWNDIYIDAKAWKETQYQIISATTYKTKTEFAVALPGQKANEIKVSENSFPGTIDYYIASGSFSGGVYFWWRSIGHSNTIPVTVLIWER